MRRFVLVAKLSVLVLLCLLHATIAHAQRATHDASVDRSMDAGLADAVTITADAAVDPDAASAPGSESIGQNTSNDADAAPDASSVQITSTRVALVDTAPIGVDPAAATFVDNVLREHLTRIGLTPLATAELYESARRLMLPFPVPEVGLAHLAEELQAEMVFACDLRARSGFYFATVRLRSRDEPSERSLAVVATQWTLGDRVREAVLLLLRGANGSSPTVASPMLSPETAPSAYAPRPYSFGAPVSVPPPPAVLLHPRPFELALVGHAAFNPGRDPFINGLVGLRFAYFPLDRLGISASLSYANLRGRTGRVHNVLPLAGVETAVDLVPSIGLYVPLRFEFGYLPYNGIVGRLTAGLAFTLFKQLRLELDFVQPTLWMVGENASISLDIGASLLWTFGRDRTPRERRRRTRSTQNAPQSTAQTSTSAPATSNDP
jgi:hypothetical protein